MVTTVITRATSFFPLNATLDSAALSLTNQLALLSSEILCAGLFAFSLVRFLIIYPYPEDCDEGLTVKVRMITRRYNYRAAIVLFVLWVYGEAKAVH